MAHVGSCSVAHRQSVSESRQVPLWPHVLSPSAATRSTTPPAPTAETQPLSRSCRLRRVPQITPYPATFR